MKLQTMAPFLQLPDQTHRLHRKEGKSDQNEEQDQCVHGFLLCLILLYRYQTFNNFLEKERFSSGKIFSTVGIRNSKQPPNLILRVVIILHDLKKWISGSKSPRRPVSVTPSFIILLYSTRSNAVSRKAQPSDFPTPPLRRRSPIKGFEFSFNPKPNKRPIRHPASDTFIERKEHVLVYRPAGAGKSHVAQASGIVRVGLDIDILFRKAVKLPHFLPRAGPTLSPNQAGLL